jgi:hypothetical protein
MPARERELGELPPGTSREGVFAVKVGGGGMRRHSHVVRGEDPEEQKAQEGLRMSGATRFRLRTCDGEQGPEDDGAFTSRRRARPTPRGHPAGETRHGSGAGDDP